MACGHPLVNIFPSDLEDSESLSKHLLNHLTSTNKLQLVPIIRATGPKP